jgi:hypothetical protein
VSAKRRAVVWAVATAAVVAAGAVLCVSFGHGCLPPAVQKVVNRLPGGGGTRTVEDVVAKMGPAAEARLQPHFTAARAAYPPPRIALVVLKEEKRLELWAEAAGRWVLLHAYPVLAASGGPGPKRREGDRQVPEGLYAIESLNPNSGYHLSMKLDYPNAFDRRWADADGRDNPGGDIFIHGKAVSIGCVAVGDEAIEELFCLVQRVGVENVRVLIAPREMRGRAPVAGLPVDPPWVSELYATLARELRAFTP